MVELSEARWRKSSHSGTQSECVELAWLPERIAVRDSKQPHGPALIVSRAAMRTMLSGLRVD